MSTQPPVDSGIVQQTEAYARDEPMQALGIAFGAGLVLTLLPIGGIVSGLVRLALTLVRPALLLLGAVKVYEQFNERQSKP